MPSWQARTFNLAVKTLVRRRDWGDVGVVARRARRVFGAPWPYQWIVRQGLTWRRVGTGNVHGEWLIPDRPTRGAILYIHGGGFVACSAATHRPITASLARRTGLAVFSADYRLAPENPFPAAIDDVVAVYEWLVRETGGAPTALAGDSAGGGLALSLAIRARDAGLQQPACAVGFSPWTDLAGRGASIRENDGRCAMFRPENIGAFAAAYVGGLSADDPRVSPVYADLRELPPLLLQVGSTELLLDDSRRVHERVLAAGGESRLTVYDDVHHGWQMLGAFVPEARSALGEVATFIHEHVCHPERSCPSEPGAHEAGR